MLEVDNHQEGGSGMTLSPLDRATALIASAQLELETKGFSSGVAHAAVERARGLAQHYAGAVSPEIRDRAFLDLLIHQLHKAEDWAQKQQAALDEEMPDEDEVYIDED